MLHRLARATLQTYRSKTGPMMAASALSTLAMIAQAWLFAYLVNAAFLERQTLAELTKVLYGLLIVIGIRAAARYWQERAAGELALLTKRYLRNRLLAQMIHLGPFVSTRQGDMVHALTDGLENVEQYIARYLPQLVYAMLIPLLTGIAMIAYEPLVGIILLVTLPLIPFFMILIGKKAESMNRAQWDRMSMLSGHFLDVLQGMTTLKVFGRAKEQIQVIARLSGEFRDATLKVLRVAFLSALVLELISTISTALLAVYLGIALLYDAVPFFPALFILLIAPEFYAPLRQLGAAFHTGMAGKTALEQIGDLLEMESREPVSGTRTIAAPLQEITFDAVSFSYTKDAEAVPALAGITLTLNRESPTMLVGQSGAGKSTMAYLLLRLLGPDSGDIRVNGVPLADIDINWWREQIAYVPQTPYIPAGTIRDAIAFGRSATEEDIQEAAKQAEAHDFIMALPEGYDTMLGEGGLGLSGGQRQRLAIARAFIGQAQILLLDEATAHLDIETEHALARALGRLMQGKIVLCIGHRLTTMHWVEQLVVMRNGRVEGIGTYDDLYHNNAYFALLVQQGMGDQVATFSKDKEGVREAVVVDNTCQSIQRDKTTMSTDSEALPTVSAWKALRTVLPVLRPGQSSVWLGMFLSFLTIFMNVGLLTCSAWLIATAALHPEQEALALAIVGVRFFGISRAVCRYLERLVSHTMAFHGLYDLRVWFYRKLEPLAPGILQHWRSGDLLGRIMADIETLQFFYLRVLVPPVGALVLTGIVAYGLHFYDRTLAVLTIGAFLIGGIVLPGYVLWHNTRVMERTLMARSLVKECLVDLLGGLLDTIAYGQQQASLRYVQDACQTMERSQSRVHSGVNQADTGLLLLAQLTMLAGACLVIPAVSAGSLSGVTIAVVAFCLLSYFEALGPMHLAFTHGKESIQAMQRLVTITSQPPLVVEPKEGIAANDRIQSSVTNMKREMSAGSTLPSSHERTKQNAPNKPAGYTEPEIPANALGIRLETVSVRYGDKTVFDNLSLTIQPGERVALVGPSGAGKTTLLSLLERLYPYEGKIFIGDAELSTLSGDAARDHYDVLTQDTYIFHASLGDNIRLAKPRATEAEMAAALDFAALTDFVNSLPQGLDTLVGHGGLGLSGGQRQRVALARLYLRQRPVVLLDEPLEGLDAVTAQGIRESLQAYTKGKTTIYITHSLLGLAQMDRILFLQNGRIIEQGTYAELIARRGSFYQYCYLSMASLG